MELSNITNNKELTTKYRTSMSLQLRANIWKQSIDLWRTTSLFWGRIANLTLTFIMMSALYFGQGSNNTQQSVFALEEPWRTYFWTRTLPFQVTIHVATEFERAIHRGLQIVTFWHKSPYCWLVVLSPITINWLTN